MRVALVGCRNVGTWPTPPTPDDPQPWARDDRPLLQALRAEGAQVACPAWDDPEVRWEDFDIALLRTTWDYHHRPAEFLAWVDRAAAATQLLNPAPVVRWNAHKGYLRDLAVPQPETVWLEPGQRITGAELEQILQQRGWSRAFLKPAIGATAEGTLRFGTVPQPGVASLEQAAVHLQRLLLASAVLLQPYVASVEGQGERSAIAVDGQPTHFVRKIPVAGDWRVQDDYGASDAPHAPDPSEQAFVRQVLDALEARWGRLPVARIDWLVGETGPWLVELELIEPCLFFRHGPEAAARLARALLSGTRLRA